MFSCTIHASPPGHEAALLATSPTEPPPMGLRGCVPRPWYAGAVARVGVEWLTELDESRVRTMSAVRDQTVDPAALCALADMEAFASLNLDPMPVDPIAHLRV